MPVDHISFARQVPVAKDCDVLVVGGGPAGFAAALAAARSGARTVLVERYGFLGGSATAAMVGPFMSSFSNDGQIQIVRGVFDELLRRMEQRVGAIHPAKIVGQTPYTGYWKFAHDHIAPFDAEAMKLVAAEMCLEAGVTLYLHSLFIAPIIIGASLSGAIIATKSGLLAVRSRVTVDCTGDADVAFGAGAPTTKGRPIDGKAMPMTMFWRIANIDVAPLEAYQRAHPDERLPFAGLIEEARAKGEFPLAKQMVDVYLEPNGVTWRVNMSKVLGLDGTDAEALTEAEIEGRRQVAFLFDFLRRNLPGAENSVLVDSAAQIGLRETRRVVGEYVLSANDVAEGKAFSDAIAFGSFPIDVPNPDGIGGSFTAAAAGTEGGYPVPNFHSIPYRSLVPLEVDNLLVAGRCLSATHEAVGAVRVMPPCFAMGQAAGTAAALAVATGQTPRSLDAQLLRSRLGEQGCYIV